MSRVISYCDSCRDEPNASGVKVVTFACLAYIVMPLTRQNRQAMHFLMKVKVFAGSACY